MPLQATSGAASYDAFGGGVAAVPNYIEDVFSTYLWTTSSSDQTLTTGIDMTKGALTWLKGRSNAISHILQTGVGGGVLPNNALSSNNTNAYFGGNYRIADSTTGFTVGTDYYTGTPETAVAWTFRKQPKFFDVVTYTGNGTNGRTVAHSLGSTPGCIIVKRTDAANGWAVYHRAMNASPQDYMMRLNATDGAFTTTPSRWNNTLPTSTEFTLSGNDEVNGSGATYVAYLFAHNAGGFGLTGTDNVISCGSFTTDGSGNATIDLGYEPQWVLMKSSSSSSSNWILADTMRGWTVDGAGGNANRQLYANTSDAEAGGTPANLNSTGFTFKSSYSGYFSTTFIYIAIRRGPMKVPTSGTSVFAPVSATPSGATTVTTNFPVDLAINAQRDAGTSGNKVFWDRLRGSSTAAGQGIFSNLTNAEVSYSGNGIGLQSNTTIVDNYWNTLNGATTPVIYWNMRRAPSFFDEVCYTGTGSATTFSHNLGAVPEMMIVKTRSDNANWAIYTASLGPTKSINFTTAAAGTYSVVWNDTAPTSSVFTVGTASTTNNSGSTYVAYLFATCAGVSKVFSYTGNGSSQTINCGFTAGARWILIKRTDSTGDWYVWDSARGIVSGNDPHLSLNTTAAEVTTDDTIDTDSTGFVVNQVSATNVNVSSATYIGIAIA